MKALHIRDILPNFCAGLISGLVTLTYSISYIALIFSGELSSYLSLGGSSALIGAALLSLIVALTSSLPFTIAGPDGSAAAVVAVMATAIASRLTSLGKESEVFPTIWVTLLLSTVFTGIFLYILGRLHLGRFIRFIPYPVVGGFLAGVGWLLTAGSFTVMAGIPLSLATLPDLLEFQTVLHWVPGLLLGVLLKVALGRYKHFLVMPSLLLLAIAFAHLGLWLTGIPLAEASHQGWLYESFSSRQLLKPWIAFSWESVNWSVLAQQFGNLITLVVVVAINILLGATGLEIATEQDVDLDHELRSSGMANVFTGLCGGMEGHLSLSRSLVNYKAGANHRLAGVVAALFCTAVLFWGGAVLSYIPKPVLGGLLLYLGIDLLIEWCYEAWFNISHLDYVLILIILLIVANFGFLQGVGVGLVISCLLFVVKYSTNHVIRNALSGSNYRSKFERSFHEQKLLRTQGEQLCILCLQGYVFFGTANTLLNYVRERLVTKNHPAIRFLILDFRLVAGLDSSAALSFIKMKQLAQKCSVTLVFTQLSPRVLSKLQKSGCIEQENEQNCQTFPDLDRGVEWCESKIIETAAFRRKRFIPLVIQLEEFFPLPHQVKQFMRYLEKLQVPSGFFLFRQGDAPKSLYFIESGQVSLLLDVDHGQIKRLGTSSAGTVIGYVGLYRNSPHPASAITDQSSRLYRLSSESLQKMQIDEPQLAAAFHQFIARLLAERLVQAREGMEILLK